jgi:hypothetical protein
MDRTIILCTFALINVLCVNNHGVTGYRIENELSSQDYRDEELSEILRGARNYADEQGGISSRTKTPDEEIVIECPNDRLDVIFLIDSSSKSSVGESGWQSLLSFVNEMIDSFSVGQDAVHVGVVRYADVVDTPISLTDFTDKESLKSAVSGLSFVDRPNANLITAFNDAYRMVAAQGRTTATTSLVIVADTVPVNSDDAIADVVEFFHSENIHVSSIAVKEPNQVATGSSSDDDSQFLLVDSYSKMSTKLVEAISHACPMPGPRLLCRRRRFCIKIKIKIKIKFG